jgi:hypothetical protein
LILRKKVALTKRIESLVLKKKVDAGMDVVADLRIGSAIVAESAARCKKQEAAKLTNWARQLEKPKSVKAALEIAMGEEQEIHVFNTPTVVVAPAGLVHCPLITRKVEKPYSFSAICLSTEHKTTWLG